jgi:hypothetical protein
MKLPLLLLLLLAGCAYVEATTVPYVGVPTFAPVDPATVKVLAAEPKERHDRLGEVVLYASPDPAPAPADIEKRFREEAAKWGANAVYVVRDILPPGRERQLVGIAIRYHP